MVKEIEEEICKRGLIQAKLPLPEWPGWGSLGISVPSPPADPRMFNMAVTGEEGMQTTEATAPDCR